MNDTVLYDPIPIPLVTLQHPFNKLLTHLMYVNFPLLFWYINTATQPQIKVQKSYAPLHDFKYFYEGRVFPSS